MSAEDLIQYAKNNDLYIHGRTSPQEWEELLNENGGKCPCGHSDVCPCEVFLGKMKNPETPPADQVCGCTFYVTKGYLTHYKRQPWGETITDDTPKQAAKKVSKTDKEPSNAKEVTYQKVNDDIPQDVEKQFLKTAGKYMEGLKLIENGELDKFVEIARVEEATNPCELCQADADILASHGEYAGALCKHGSGDCEKEIGSLIKRTMTVIDENFMSAGYSKTATGESVAVEKKPGKKNAWIEFSSKIMTDPSLDGLPQKNKMKIAASMYRGEFSSIEKAKEALSA